MIKSFKSMTASALCAFGLLSSYATTQSVPMPKGLKDLTDPVSGAAQGVASKDSATSLNAGSASRAFDNVDLSDWYNGRFLAKNGSSPAPVSVAFTFNEEKVVNAYSIIITAGDYYTPARAPKAWTVYGSDDYIAQSESSDCSTGKWTLIASVENETDWGNLEKRYFTMTNATAYRSYKIVFTANNGDASWTDIAELEFFKAYKYDLAKATVTFVPKFGTYDGGEHKPTYSVVAAEDDTPLTEGFTESWDKDGFIAEGIYTLTLTPEEDSDYRPGSPLVAQYRIWPENPLPEWECVKPSSPFDPMDQAENVAYGRSGKVTNGVLNKDDSTAQYAGDYTISFDGPKDIYELKVYSSWDTGRDGFGIDKVYVLPYGETGYTQLTDVPAFDEDKNWGSQCAWLKIREDLPLAENVTAVRIHFSECEAGWIGLGEIEVRGRETGVVDLDRAVVTFNPEFVCYNGDEHKPEVTVSKDGAKLDPAGYELTWEPAEMRDAGIYKLTVEPSTESKYIGSKTAFYRIWPESGTGDPDETDVVYTWKGNDSTQWDAVTNWNSSVIECFGFPSNVTHATAKFPAGVTATVIGQGQTFGLKGLSVNGDVTLSGMTLEFGDHIYGVNGGRLTLDGVMLDNVGDNSIQLRGKSVWTFMNDAGLTKGYLYREGDDGATVTVLNGVSELRGLCDNNQNAPLTLVVSNAVAKFTNDTNRRWQIINNATVDLCDGAFQCSWVPNSKYGTKMTSSFVWKVDCLNLPESAAAAITFWDAGAYKAFLSDDGSTIASKIKVAYDRAFAEKGKLKWTPIIRFAVPTAEQTPELEAALKSMVEFVGSDKPDVGSCKVVCDGDTMTVWAKAGPSGLLIHVK